MTVDFERVEPVDYLTRLAASDFGVAYKSLVMEEMAFRPGHTVVDLGCGPGADLGAFAEAVGPAGAVIGVDNDNDAVEQARRAVADVPNVRVMAADIHELALSDGSVHRAHTDRVFQHVADPLTVLSEAYRVLRPGGRVVLAEPDWDTLVVDFPRVAVAVAYRRFVTDRVVRNSRIGRQLPRLAAAAGFEVTRVVPATVVFRTASDADQVFGFHRVTHRAVAAGYLSAADAHEWLAHLASAPFFASATLFVVVGRRG